ncbi:beta-lactamase domain-containing protein [Candidatus Magnetoovum chiemensis]|nr:beta-lactamase domain-containing protein [Candidatus Magnetoovum chiemensis]
MNYKNNTDEIDVSIPDGGGKIAFPSGDFLEIVPAHFLHSVGNFHVYDPSSKILFTSDVGAAALPHENKSIFVKNFNEHVKNMEAFHKRYMLSNTVCKYYADMVKRYDIKMITPHHGAVLTGEQVGQFLNWLSNLKCGIDNLKEIYKR